MTAFSFRLSRPQSLGHIEVVKILLAAGADVDARIQYGRTALSLAAMNGHLDVVQMLVAANANLDVKDAEGFTALTIAEREIRTQW